MALGHGINDCVLFTKYRDFLRKRPKPNKDTGGEFIFAEASILTNRVFRHLPNLKREG
jgi:hypothetical protein